MQIIPDYPSSYLPPRVLPCLALSSLSIESAAVSIPIPRFPMKVQVDSFFIKTLDRLMTGDNSASPEGLVWRWHASGQCQWGLKSEISFGNPSFFCCCCPNYDGCCEISGKMFTICKGISKIEHLMGCWDLRPVGLEEIGATKLDMLPQISAAVQRRVSSAKKGFHSSCLQAIIEAFRR